MVTKRITAIRDKKFRWLARDSSRCKKNFVIACYSRYVSHITNSCIFKNLIWNETLTGKIIKTICHCIFIFSYLRFIIFQIVLSDLQPTFGSWQKRQIIPIVQWRIVNYRNNLSLHIHTHHPVWQNLKATWMRIMEWGIFFNKIW